MASWRIVRALQAKTDAEKSAKAAARELRGPEKLADKPHPLTVVLALLSPSLAVVAAAISWSAYSTSQQAMKVGQRAYVVLQSSTTNVIDISRAIRRDDSLFTVCVEYVFQVKNIGHTPATILHLDTRYKSPEGWQVQQGTELIVRRELAFGRDYATNLSQDESATFSERDYFVLSKEAERLFSNPLVAVFEVPSSRFDSTVIGSIDNRLTVKDVFGDSQELRW